MKTIMKIYALMLMAFFTQNLMAQTAATGDYRSVQSGNWSSTATWQVRDASGNWTTPSAAPTSSNNVYIQLLHKLTLDIATANCNDLHLQTTDSLGLGSNTLQVSGKIRSYNSYQITNGALTSNVVTITTSAAHSLSIGNSVIIVGLAGTLLPVNGTYTVASVPSSTTFTYALTNADITTTTSGTTTGSVTKNVAAVTSGVDGSFYSAQVSSTAINGTMLTSTSGAGGIKFIGNSRRITSTGEWTGNSISLLVDFNFALNAGQTDSLLTVFGGRNLTFSSGTTVATTRVTPGAGSPGTGTVTIKSGATFSSNSPGSTQVMSRTSTSTFGTLTIEAGGTLELTGSLPTIDVHTIVNNGNVVYNRGGAQTLLAKGASTDVSPNNSIDFTSYNNLTIKTTTAKTIPSGVTINVAGTLTYAGGSTDTLVSVGGSALTYGAGATLAFSGTSSLALSLTQANLIWPITNGPTNVLVTANTFSFAASAGISRTITGTLTLNGGNFTINTGNTLVMANNSTIIRSDSLSSMSSGLTIGTSASDVVNITINSAKPLTMGNEFLSSPAPGGYGTLTVASGSTYTINSGRTITNLANNGVIIFSTAATFTTTINGNITGTGTITGNIGASITIAGTGNGSAGTLYFTNGSQVVNNITLSRTGTNPSLSLGTPVTVYRNISLGSGTTLDGGSFVDTVKGSITGSSGGFYTFLSGGKVVLSGTSTTTPYTLSGATFSNIELASSAYTLSSSPTINGVFDLKTNVLKTSSNSLRMAAGATLSRTTGWVNGTLRKNISTGNGVVRTYEIGDSLKYTPVTIRFDTVKVAGDFSVKTDSATAEANFATAPIDKANYVNRYWATTSISPLSFTTYSATLNYVASDLVGNATAANIIAALYSSNWATNAVTVAGTYSNTISAIATSGDFILGKCGTLVTPTVTISLAKDTICNGSITTFTPVSANGGTAPSFEWFKNGQSQGTVNGDGTITFGANTLSTGNNFFSCVITANNLCQTASTVSSNTITLFVKQSPLIGVSTITANTLCATGVTTNVYNSNTQGGGVWSSTNPAVATVSTVNSGSGVVTTTGYGVDTLTYTKTSSNGCSESRSTTLSVVQATSPGNITGNNSICRGFTTTLGGVSGGTWSTPSSSIASVNSSGVVTGNSAGNATIVYTVASNGCNATSTYNVTVNPTPTVPSMGYVAGTPNPQTGTGGAFCVGKTFKVVGTSPITPVVPNLTGVWSSSDTSLVSINAAGSANNKDTALVVIKAAGTGVTLTYKVTSPAGCINNRATTFNTSVTCPFGRGVNKEELMTNSVQFTMYPNPARSTVSLQVEKLVGTGSIMVTDLYGKQVKTQALSMGNNTVDVSSLSKGFYLISVITTDGKTTKKLVVE